MDQTKKIDADLSSFLKSDIFTPDNICEKMSKYLDNKKNLLEPSVGEGNLLKHLDLDKYSSIDIYDIKKEYLDKCIKHKNINIHLLDFLKTDIQKKYNNIILNPPYIRIQDLSIEYRNFIKNKWIF